jgi:hypothetical protein
MQDKQLMVHSFIIDLREALIMQRLNNEKPVKNLSRSAIAELMKDIITIYSDVTDKHSFRGIIDAQFYSARKFGIF